MRKRRSRITRAGIHRGSQSSRSVRPNRGIPSGMIERPAMARVCYSAGVPGGWRENRRMAQDHDHDADGHHHGSELSEMQLRVRALETVLAEKGYIDPDALDAIIEAYETKVGPHTGALFVAKAWSDPAFKRALVEDASKAVASFGLLN